MKLTNKQIRAIKKLNISGRGGKDKEIAEALGHDRVNAKYYDGVDKNNKAWEYKKQERQQFLDPYKFSQMSEEEKNISI